MRAALIANPLASRVTPELLAAVERELGPAETRLTRARGHATELAAELSEGCDRIYVLSGDGVYNEVVNGLAGPGTPSSSGPFSASSPCVVGASSRS